MVAVNTSGSQSATVDTEHTLATVTDAKLLVLFVDVGVHILGDLVELRIYGKARSSDSERQLWEGSVPNLPTNPLVFSIPIPSPHYAKFTLKQTAGAANTYPWAVYEY